jgi:hypothetical protein
MLKVFTCLYDITGVPESERKGTGSPRVRVETIMESLDTNKDNYLSLEEFLAGSVNDERIRSLLVDPLFYCRI